MVSLFDQLVGKFADGHRWGNAANEHVTVGLIASEDVILLQKSSQLHSGVDLQLEFIPKLVEDNFVPTIVVEVLSQHHYAGRVVLASVAAQPELQVDLTVKQSDFKEVGKTAVVRVEQKAVESAGAKLETDDILERLIPPWESHVTALRAIQHQRADHQWRNKYGGG